MQKFSENLTPARESEFDSKQQRAARSQRILDRVQKALRFARIHHRDQTVTQLLEGVVADLEKLELYQLRVAESEAEAERGFLAEEYPGQECQELLALEEAAQPEE